MPILFDVFEILVPKLATDLGFEVRARESAFGQVVQRFLDVNGARFAQVVPANVFYTDAMARTGSKEGPDWIVLAVAPIANDAAEDQDSWSRFLESLVVVLRAHSIWRVVCESDCDQQPRQRAHLSGEEVATLIDSYRNSLSGSIAIEIDAR